MTIRTLTILTAFWVLLAAPTVCLGGLLEHSCTDCPEEEACSHEEDCAYDPCGNTLATLSRSSEHAASDIAAVPAVIVTIDTNIVDSPDHLVRASSPPGRNVPRPISDLPLLI